MLYAELVREDRQSDEEDREDARHPHQRGRGVLRLRLLERGNAVRDGLDTRERGASGCKSAQDDEPRQAVRAGDHPLVGELCRAQARVDRDADESHDDQNEEPDDERICRDREDRPRFADATEVQQRDDRHEPDGQLDAERVQLRDRRGDREHAGGDRDSDRKDVVDGERGRRGEPGDVPEVLARDDVRAAAARVRLDRLTVRERHDREQDADGERDRDRARERAGPGDGEDEQDFVGRIGAG